MAFIYLFIYLSFITFPSGGYVNSTCYVISLFHKCTLKTIFFIYQ